jgi:hypothetical protein
MKKMAAEAPDDDLLWYVHGNIAGMFSDSRHKDVLLLGVAVIAVGYEIRAHRAALDRIVSQLEEIDRTLVGSLDDLIANGREFVKAADRLLGGCR